MMYRGELGPRTQTGPAVCFVTLNTFSECGDDLRLSTPAYYTSCSSFAGTNQSSRPEFNSVASCKIEIDWLWLIQWKKELDWQNYRVAVSTADKVKMGEDLF